MGFLAILLAAALALELLSGLLFAIAFIRRRIDREFRVAAILCVAAAAHTLGALVATHAGGVDASRQTGNSGWWTLLAFMAFAIHYALVSGSTRTSWGALAGPYALAAAFALLDLQGRLHVPRHEVPGTGPFGIATYVVAALEAAAVLSLVSRNYLKGHRDALAVVVGAAVLLAATINDAATASGTLTSSYLSDAGLVAFILTIASTPSARYAAVSTELDLRSQELQTRTRELRRSYEDLRAAQEELVKKEQLAVVGELAAVIAHEVRNPLAIIANAVAGLRKQVISREDHETLLSILDEETSRLNRLVTDLLRYARPVNVQRSHFSLADLLDRTLGLAKTDRKAIKAELRIECNEGRIWGDSNLLRQVFDNLVDNAVQAMGGGGTLTIRLRAAMENGVDGVAVDIADTGEGMDTQVRSRARDPFFTTRPSGTGLGLAIVDRIVDAHDGHFAIDSRAGEGTTVTVFLPHGSSSEPPLRPRTKPVSEPSSHLARSPDKGSRTKVTSAKTSHLELTTSAPLYIPIPH